MKPTRQTQRPRERSKKVLQSYFRKPDLTRDPLWLAQVLATVDFLREQELIRRVNERKLFDLKQASKLNSIGPQGSSKSSGTLTPEEWAQATKGLTGVHRQNLYLVKQYAEKRGGVMTDKSLTIPGRRVIETTSTGGSPRVTTTSTLVQAIAAWDKVLDLVASVDGDHVRPNPHHFRIKRWNYGQGRTWAGDAYNNTIVSGNQALAFGLTDTFSNEFSMVSFVYNKALSKLYENIRGDVDLSVDAFQARQAGVMVNQRFKQARELFLRKAPFALVEMVKITQAMKRSNPRDWGSLWLEWTYGWKPLAGSIFGAADQMVKVATAPTVRSLPVRAQASEVGDNRLVRSINGQGVISEKFTKSVYQSRITSYFAMQNSRLNAVAGLTSLNPVSIAWELVPYSFVADWFVDIGSYLRNMESSLLYGSQFTGGYTIKRSRKQVFESATGGNSAYSVGVKGDAETLEFDRSSQSSSPIPRAPTFNPKLGTSRLISAASLLSQQLRSFKR